jgi:4-amino-4-deoxy-L-arabinose transferase-like glycosyltransferase
MKQYTRHFPTNDMPLWNRYMPALALLAIGLLFINLHVGDLSGYDDAFHAQQGKAILSSGDMWTIRHNGYHNPEFPPLFYWIEALSMKMLGVNDVAAKFPSALLGFLTILAVYFIAYELTRKTWLALIAMAILMTTQYFMKYATHAMTDVPFTFFISLAVLFYLKGFRHAPFFLLSGLSVGLALLTRPYVGLLALGLFLTHVLWIRRTELLRSRYVPAGIFLAVFLPVLWYAIQYRLHGPDALAGPSGLIFKQLTSGTIPDPIEVVKGLWHYPGLLLKLYWPWLPFMLVGFSKEFRKAFRERDQAASLLLLWIGWILVPFSFGSEKVLRYVMPVFPAFAVLAAIPLHQWIPVHRRRQFMHGFLVLGAAGLMYMHFYPGTLLRATDMRALAPVAEANSSPSQRVILYTYGERHWNFQNQLLWYADRYTEFAVTPGMVLEMLHVDPGAPVIMDKETFHQFRQAEGSGYPLTVLGESERFVCFAMDTSRVEEMEVS